MKKLLYSLVVLVLSCNTNSYSASSGFGIGLLAGTSKTKITNISKFKKLSDDNNKIYNYIIRYMLPHVQDTFFFSSSPNPFTEKSGLSFDLGATMFYQIGIKNFFIRPGIVCNFPVANNDFSPFKLSVTETVNNITETIDIPLIHSFDIGGQLLLGFTVAKIFSLVLGGEVGYTKWKLNGRYSINLDGIKKHKEETAESYGKVFWRGIIGCEFNIGNVILGVHAFAGPINIKLSEDSTTSSKTNSNNIPDKLKLINGGARLMLAYKF